MHGKHHEGRRQGRSKLPRPDLQPAGVVSDGSLGRSHRMESKRCAIRLVGVIVPEQGFGICWTLVTEDRVTGGAPVGVLQST